MSNYVYFTQQEKQQAHETNIEELLRREGETLKRSGTELQWGDGSNKVTIRGNTWYHQYEQVGGDAISFVQRFYGKSFPDAVQFLLGKSVGTVRQDPQKQYPKAQEAKAISSPRGFTTPATPVEQVMAISNGCSLTESMRKAKSLMSMRLYKHW